GNISQQPLGEHAGERRDIELNEIGQIGIEHALQRVAQRRMVAPDREHAETAEEIKIACAVAIVEILPLPLLEADIVADGLEHPNKLLVQVTRMQGAALRLAIREKLSYVCI